MKLFLTFLYVNLFVVWISMKFVKFVVILLINESMKTKKNDFTCLKFHANFKDLVSMTQDI